MRVVALNRFEYANKLRLPGDEFDTTSQADADILEIAKQVIKVSPKDTLDTRDMKADVGRLRSRYRHRAMRADE